MKLAKAMSVSTHGSPFYASILPPFAGLVRALFGAALLSTWNREYGSDGFGWNRTGKKPCDQCSFSQSPL